MGNRISKKVITVWAAIVVTGSVAMMDYSTRPGRAAAAPAKVAIDENSVRPVLQIYLHPYCPCSRATMAELARLIARNPDKLDVEALFYRPVDETEDWVKTDIWDQALKIPDVKVSIISDAELKHSGAIVSGQALLYDTSGQLVFSGGITGSRGNEGDNLGRYSIEEYVRTGSVTASTTPVFGCVISAPDQ